MAKVRTENWGGGFQGTCHLCGVYGHRINEGREKDADMKGKGKGQDSTQDMAWNPQNPHKGKGKGQKAFWKGGKATWGKGKGAYSMEDDWSSGYSGYSFDTPLFSSSLAQEAPDGWKTVKSKREVKPHNPNRTKTTTQETKRGPACPCHITNGEVPCPSRTSTPTTSLVTATRPTVALTMTSLYS